LFGEGLYLLLQGGCIRVYSYVEKKKEGRGRHHLYDNNLISGKRKGLYHSSQKTDHSISGKGRRRESSNDPEDNWRKKKVDLSSIGKKKKHHT